MILNLLFTIQLDSDIKSNDYNSAWRWGAELGSTTPLSHRPYWRRNLLWIRIHFGLRSWPCRFLFSAKTLPSTILNVKPIFDQAWEVPSMQQLQVCFLDWVLLLSLGKAPNRCDPNCQAHSTSSRRGAVLVVCYKLKKFYNKMSTFILCWTAPCYTPMTKLRQMFKYQTFIF